MIAITDTSTDNQIIIIHSDLSICPHGGACLLSHYLFGPYFTCKLFALFLCHWLQSVFVQQYLRIYIVPLIMFGAHQYDWRVGRVLCQFLQPLGLDTFETVWINDAETHHEDIGIGIGETSQYGEVLLKLKKLG